MSIQIGNLPYTERVQKGLSDSFMRSSVAASQYRLKAAREGAFEELGDWEKWRELGEQIRQHTLENLDYYLEQLSTQVEARGGKVFFAKTPEEATSYIKQVIVKKQAKKVVKSKSMMTEEIGLNNVLQAEGVEVIETDLGEWIIQLDEDRPSHIVAPALHKDRVSVRETFSQKRNYDGTDEPTELTKFARNQLRQEFLTADVGITGCNFAVAESGTVTLVTNEGNGRMITTLPDTHIAVMGMERIVPTWEELDILVSLLARAAVGQKLSTYVTTVTGPRLDDEIDGASDFHLVIVDNGRSNILGTDFQPVLQCIRCAACINVCPVYRHIGGHAYGSIYPGPIGAVLTPLLDGYEKHHELPYASSLCAACTEVCPVKIPLHELLIKHRQIIVEEEKIAPPSEKFMMKAYAKWASHPAAYRFSSKLAHTALKPWNKDNQIENGPGPLKTWTKTRDFPMPPKQTFRAWYENRSKGRKADE